MKHKIFLIVVVSIFYIPLNAQRFNGGILTGINASQIDGDRLAGYHKAGLLFGVFVNTDFNEKIGGQLEIKYSAKGSSTAIDAANKLKVRLNYIDIPVLITFDVFKYIELQTGASLNYLFNAKYYDGGWSDDFMHNPVRIETSAVFGINFSYFKNFDLNVRYNYSLLPVRMEYNGTTFLDQGLWFNNVLSFALYFQIGQ